MGIIIAKFRKKKTTYELLEKLDNEIRQIEDFRRNTEQTQKKMVGRFVFISVCVYCVIAFIFYFYFFPASLYDRIIYIIPLLILPVLLIFIKRGLTWYYNRKIRKNQNKLSTLKDEKKKVLEDVMDKETYKVAKSILEKFAPEQVRKSPTPIQSTPIRPIGSAGQFGASTTISQTGLRYRSSMQLPPGSKAAPYGTPSKTPLVAGRALMPPPSSMVPTRTASDSHTPVPSSVGRPDVTGTWKMALPMPRPIIPGDRSVLDKMVDYLVGDGPSNRYAMICKHCFNHNGMALKEEFEYLSFRCCFCMAYNPARKKRLAAPKLDGPHHSIEAKPSSDSTDSERESDSESDTASPIITEHVSGDSHEKSSEAKMEPQEASAGSVDVVETKQGGSPEIVSSDSEKLSEFEKISDAEKDVDISPMEVDASMGDGSFSSHSHENKPQEIQQD